MKKALIGAVVAVGMMAFAAPAFAQGGFIEICKSSPAGAFPTGLSNTPTFSYTVTGVAAPVVVPNNSCSNLIPVTPGNVTVTEIPGSFFSVDRITTSPGSALVSSTNGTAVVAVPASTDASGAVVVNYHNIPVTGYLKICKNNASDSGLTGSFSFTITGPANSGFSQRVTVPIGQCSFPILVPAGSDTVTEDAPNSVTSITVQGGSATTNPAGGTATVTVQPSPTGDFSREAIVTFANRTVQLKICKAASDSGVTQPYTFTAAGTGDPTFPGGVTRNVVVRPGQCQLVPGPYTNPNGTTGWRAGTRVAISEGAVAGTAVTAIAVSPAGNEIPGTRVISPLVNPTLPGPAGSDAVLLGAGETQVTFTNDTRAGGTLELCLSPDAKAAAGTMFTFTVSEPIPGDGTAVAHAAVGVGNCVLIPNPSRSDGLWLYNGAVTITETPIAGLGLVSIAASPTARLLSSNVATGTGVVSIGSGDVTTAIFTNDPAGVSSSSGSSGSSSANGSASSSSAGAVAAIGGSNAGKAAGKAAQLRSAKLIKLHGAHYLVLRVASKHKTAKVRVTELNKHGKKIRSFVVTVKTNRAVNVKVPWGASVKTVAASLVS